MASPSAPPRDLTPDIAFADEEFWWDILEGAIRVCVNILVAIVLFIILAFVIFVVVRCVKCLVNNPKRPMSPKLSQLLIVCIKLILWVQVIPIIISQVGLAVDSVVAVVTAVSLSIGLSMKPYAENYVSGVALLIERPYTEGDLVKLAGVVGRCKVVGLALTHLEEPDGNVVHVPNAKAIGAPMTNFTASGRARLDIPLPLHPSIADLEQARTTMLATLRAMPLVLPEPAPLILLKDVTQTSLVVWARVWVPADKILTAEFPIREALRRGLLEAKVPLATWRVGVGQALDQLERLGYPGLADDKPHVTAAAAAGAAPPRAGDDDDDEAVAAGAAMAVAL